MTTFRSDSNSTQMSLHEASRQCNQLHSERLTIDPILRIVVNGDMSELNTAELANGAGQTFARHPPVHLF